MEKVWNLKPQGDSNEMKHLSAALNVNMVIANLLVQRGIKTFSEAKHFFRPRLSDLHDPFLMKDMDKAVARIEQAVDHQEKVLVYGDYDVDGTTSVAMIYLFLKDYIQDIDYYIPDRYTEGYGISRQSIEYAARENFSLVIVLDCGIKAVEKVNLAKQHGLDFIICDHHNPGEIIPEAVAVLNPKRLECNYPYKELSGCGVGFKLLQAFTMKKKITQDKLFDLLDLVVVSIASDIVPITGENRVLAYYGLKKLNSNPGMGLQTIINYAGLNGEEITISDIVFKIGPRLNASGRIEHGKKSVQILVSVDTVSSDALGEEIDSFNEIRKTLDRDITQDALDMIERDEEMKNRNSTVIYNRDWHKGVVGIVASRLTEFYYRPTVVLTESNGLATGSARSVKDFDLYEAIGACSDLLESYGGHMFAAGLTLKIENIRAFSERFEEIVTRSLADQPQIQTIDVDAKLALHEITPRFFRIMKQFAPFGPHNTVPVFVTEDVIDAGTSRLVGKNLEHIKLDLMEPDASSGIFAGIAFNLSSKFPVIQSGIPFDICHSVELNEFRGKSNLQLNIKDLRTKT
ncbi:MAG: single-stranded-DNA-specific exonuclease RecJ [Prolixibacteraceae bacterium]|jgi:single-stranded-DNA-specific exonuclease|nr:single-stranded-DNA-specific exonuclease RecJ [Prolixibacteraceae bacterium]MDI9564324.1 single-stranded-DNA-specific exonuclease RecJ [Bacteroidota bacterium]NLS99248.1 single-stranded-DNA-specific exonuclease RecJ [Bacteroidales bacterium]OQB79676.1 MAG: Single-stranded-DNA-specific exonuclease RecJ [Bacteroidetes bacterium ADurb.Bin123]HNZ67994.1 single-stranded-DNA-specific exonuclease RecJ [Prolixibacteraceae bacterium]